MNSDTKKTTLLRLGLFFQDCLNRFEDTESDTVNIDLRNEVNLAVDLITTGYRDNGWFTKDSVLGVYTAWANALNETNIDQWLQGYDFSTGKSKKVGVIMAGNLPLVGLHDALSVIISGHVLHAKLSSKDKSLMLLQSVRWSSRRHMTCEMLSSTHHQKTLRHLSCTWDLKILWRVFLPSLCMSMWK